MRRNLPAGILVLAMAFSMIRPCLVQARAEGDPRYFHLYKMEFKGKRHDRIHLDLNGDGLVDIGMIYSRSDRRDKYWFRICLQDKSRGFTGTCSEMLMPKEARAFDLGEVDGKPGAEMVIITDKAVSMASFSDGRFGKFRELIRDRTILHGTQADRPALLHCLWDLDADSRMELILPSVEGPGIYKYSDAGFSLFQRINSPPLITYRVGSFGDIMATDDVNQFLLFRTYEKRITASYMAPDVFFEDFNADKRIDVITLVENTLRVFPQGPDGRFSQKPAVTVKKSILPPEEKGIGFAGEGMVFADLNGDGIGDIIMMKWGTSRDRTRMDRYIYYGKPGLEYPEKPDQIIRSESAAVDFGIHDLNNDGKLDLVVPFFHFAPAQAFKVMTENAIKVQFRIFLMQDNGRYSQDAGKTFAKVDRRILVNYKIDILGMIFDFKSLLEGQFHPLINFSKDFNGDGYPDLVADTGGDKLRFFWGNPEVKFANSPDLVIEYESAMDYDLVDLNNDGKCDIITYYDSEERTKKKREMAKKARDSGESVPEPGRGDSGLVTTPEGTRIKILMSK